MPGRQPDLLCCPWLRLVLIFILTPFPILASDSW